MSTLSHIPESENASPDFPALFRNVLSQNTDWNISYGDLYEAFDNMHRLGWFEQVISLQRDLDEEQRVFFGRLLFAWMSERQKQNKNGVSFTQDMVRFKSLVAQSGFPSQKSNRGFLKHSPAYGQDFLKKAA